MNDKKTLLPELLPTPRQEPNQPPRQRVAERASRMMERLRSYKGAAGAALLAAHCTYSVVDPLPPPPGQCTDLSNPFTSLRATGQAVRTDAGGSNVRIDLTSFRVIGYRIDAVRVTAAGTLLGTEDQSRAGDTLLSITVAPDGSGADILLEVDLGCGAATVTKRYRVMPSGAFTVTEL